MHPELVTQWIIIVLGVGAFAAGVIGIVRSLRLQKLLVHKQEQGLDAQATKHDPQVRAALRGLRVPLILAATLAVGSAAAPSLVRMALG
ncbi:hypothetical protein [Pseudoxanthomonas sp. JBR18]|uniref:hypothetical protein n=1 Tax=Pseudoxanthomonas sp. JBR18 TaxID=2969308 RepID=UPI0023061512|nr:hypothetical protein [Pseudoxanthomonas sp. JBR18]WCE03643.1 hypothetical protein PJ250_16335 [Pseudoxanthomonas sp. JBR18]